MDKTITIFRKYKDGEIIALFPAEKWNRNDNTCTSYVHVGQHGAADYDYVVSRTSLATPEEYADLKAELERIGYELDVKKRYSLSKKIKS